ncbi:Hypothetical protein A7982_06437 [Minicystis rosea]|nr:Hypothetical protein A7982_06437 [Minicystis rosea]
MERGDGGDAVAPSISPEHGRTKGPPQYCELPAPSDELGG